MLKRLHPLPFLAACVLIVLAYVLSAELLASLYGVWLSPDSAGSYAYLTLPTLLTAWVMGLAVLGWRESRAFARAH